MLDLGRRAALVSRLRVRGSRDGSSFLGSEAGREAGSEAMKRVVKQVVKREAALFQKKIRHLFSVSELSPVLAMSSTTAIENTLACSSCFFVNCSASSCANSPVFALPSATAELNMATR